MVSLNIASKYSYNIRAFTLFAIHSLQTYAVKFHMHILSVDSKICQVSQNDPYKIVPHRYSEDHIYHHFIRVVT